MLHQRRPENEPTDSTQESGPRMTVVTRFAPSPTGYLHIGGARTALFNWLYARHHGGTFRLRVEDTDRKRSTEEAKAAILDGLTWLELDWDGETVYQSTRAERHAEVAQEMLAAGAAYRCYCTPEELAEMREAAKREGRRALYDGRWRDRDPSEAPAGVDPVLRLKAPREGDTVIADGVQGEVRVENAQLDDMVLLRADGTPTYMLAVVVDDHDMGITHVIRGDDHLNNAFRQTQIYRALGWDVPEFAHIPLIHGSDGAKLSKRHGALGVEAYREMGMLPEAMRNYLLRLGWSHGDDEIISTEQAIEWFDLDGVGKSPARFDMAKLTNTNAHYLREMDTEELVKLLEPFWIELLDDIPAISEHMRLFPLVDALKTRARTLKELAETSLVYLIKGSTRINADEVANLDSEAVMILEKLLPILKRDYMKQHWNLKDLEEIIRSVADYHFEEKLPLRKIAQPIRVALTGSRATPSVFEVMWIIGKDEAVRRIRYALAIAKMSGGKP
jgi:glutamyl-tRNA synthetase